MIVNKSKLQLIDFDVIKGNFEFEPPSEPVEVSQLFEKYKIEFEYAIKTFQDKQYLLFAKIAINPPGDNKQKGYSVFAESISMFFYPSENSQEAVRIINSNGLSIAINSLRGYMMTLTGFGPMGKYVLPSLDVGDIMQQKAKSVAAIKKETSQQKKRA